MSQSPGWRVDKENIKLRIELTGQGLIRIFLLYLKPCTLLAPTVYQNLKRNRAANLFWTRQLSYGLNIDREGGGIEPRVYTFSVIGTPIAAPAGDTCLKLAAAGYWHAIFNSFTNGQALRESTLKFLG